MLPCTAEARPWARIVSAPSLGFLPARRGPAICRAAKARACATREQGSDSGRIPRVKISCRRQKTPYKASQRELLDFQVHHLLWQLGKEWFDRETAKPLAERHIILQWRAERAQQFREYQDPRNPNGNVRAPSTGGMKALQVLADDVYQLAHVTDPPAKLLARLRDLEQFQGARYEILIASLFARCGFEIKFIADASRRNPEFFAHKDGECIGVEAKSRHRSGVLNRRGAFDKEAPAEIKRLYEDAAGQNPGDCPFLIFIDVNHPLTPDVPLMEKPWVKEALHAFDYRQQEGRENRDTALVLTNFGWHFSREEGTPPGENCQARLEKPKYPLRDASWNCLGRALTEYGRIVDEEERTR
jgi:hypothetical protein